ncbi:hypothetical protein EOM39_01190 [Candidatus Gracilibacteria bacterium]|nr:hypothetical protein [Candidatus Gracilibacteria bacterium]
MINRCHNCKYCKENIVESLIFGYKKYYTCENENAFSNDISNDGENVYIEDAKNVEVIINLNFGCIHFEKGE